MEKEFVTYEQAVALKELRFYEETLKVYSTKWVKLMEEEYAVRYDVDYVLAPLKQQVFRWFREKYNIVIEINVYSTTDGYSFSFKILCKKYTPFIDSDDAWTTYEEAENACIDKLIEIAKQLNNK